PFPRAHARGYAMPPLRGSTRMRLSPRPFISKATAPRVSFSRLQDKAIRKTTVHTRRNLRALGDFHKVVRGERAAYGGGAVMPDHHALTEPARQRHDGRVRDRMPVQIIHQDEAPRCPPHFAEYADALVISQMMKGQ